MNGDDRTYYRHRAEVEFERAQQATRPEAMSIHRQLAKAYLERAKSEAEPLATEHG